MSRYVTLKSTEDGVDLELLTKVINKRLLHDKNQLLDKLADKVVRNEL